MEVWWINPAGAVIGAWSWVGKQAWTTYQLAPAGSAATGGGLTSASRYHNDMNCWWVQPDGVVVTAWWADGKGWGSAPLTAAGAAITTPASSIRALSRREDTVEVFWVGPDRSVQHAWWYPVGGWKNSQLAGAGSVAMIPGLTAVTRNLGHMEVFWVDDTQAINSAFWYDGAGWKHALIAPVGTVRFDGLTAISRQRSRMDLCFTGTQSDLRLLSFHDGEGWTQQQLHPEGSVFNGVRSKAGVSRNPDHLEFFWADTSGGVSDVYWFDPRPAYDRVELVLDHCLEFTSTDDFLAGAHDEVHLRRSCIDSSHITVNADQSADPHPFPATAPDGDITGDGSASSGWSTNPFVFATFDCSDHAPWLRAYTVTCFVIEEDNGDIAKEFADIDAQYRSKVAATISAALVQDVSGWLALNSFGELGSFSLSALLCSVSPLAVPVVVAAVLSAVAGSIGSFLGDEIFPPEVLSLALDQRPRRSELAAEGPPQTQIFEYDGGKYELGYHWRYR